MKCFAEKEKDGTLSCVKQTSFCKYGRLKAN